MSLAEASELVQLPETCVAEYGVTIVSYIDEAGDTMWGYATHGEATIGTLVVLLSMCAHELIHEAAEA